MSCVIRTLHQNGDRVLPSSSACGRQPGEHVGTAPGCGLRHGRMKCFIAGARLVVKNYMPFMTKILQNSLSPFPSEPAATVLSIALVSRHGVEKHPFNGARGAAPCRHPRLAWAMGPRAGRRPVCGDMGACVVYCRGAQHRWNFGNLCIKCDGRFCDRRKVLKAVASWPGGSVSLCPSLPPAPSPTLSPSWVSDA